ncbi:MULTISPECIES: hypothetical protein [unclassified Adlercreutzia]|uniref:hypothetical protein n=1 Tax=unclassified Adlercreutzia TaxID=2636013 RepID=UPI0013EAC84D|nr:MULTISPECIES: hypothetical protein [unclassified Adlercreutzia]
MSELSAQPAECIGFPSAVTPGEPHAASPGALRWYAVRVREGHEEAMAAKCASVLSPEVAEGCVAPRYEKFLRQRGSWRLVVDPVFRGYFFVAARDARALSRALGGLSFPVALAGGRKAAHAALSPDVQAWLASALDAEGVLRASEGVIEGGRLTVTRGPLMGHERSVGSVNRRKRMAYVRFDEPGGGFLLKAALNVPEKG